jgi:hypothetical protein
MIVSLFFFFFSFLVKLGLYGAKWQLLIGQVSYSAVCTPYLQLNIPNLACSYGRVFQAHLQNNRKLKVKQLTPYQKWLKRV